MKVLILGSGGFIGGHLVRYLSNNFEVMSVSRRPDGSTKNILSDGSAVDVSEIIKSIKPDVCINCTGSASVSGSFSKSEADFELNVLFVRSILQTLSTAVPKCRFVHLSSAAVYGNPQVLPILETSSLKPISPYGWHKLQAEQICAEFCTMGLVQTVSLRLFSVFGTGLKRQLLWDVFRQSQESRVLTLFGTGEETRDFVYVADLALAVELLILQQDVFDGTALNVASGRRVTVRYAAESLLKGIQWSGTLKFSSDARQGDPLQWQADITRLRALGFEPRFEFETAIEEVASWLTHLES